MFQISLADLTGILADFGVHSPAAAFSELQRYHYENYDPAFREVRLIVKVAPDSGEPLVVRFKNESDVTRELIEAQSRFAALLRENGADFSVLAEPEQSAFAENLAEQRKHDASRLRIEGNGDVYHRLERLGNVWEDRLADLWAVRQCENGGTA